MDTSGLYWITVDRYEPKFNVYPQLKILSYSVPSLRMEKSVFMATNDVTLNNTAVRKILLCSYVTQQSL